MSKVILENKRAYFEFFLEDEFVAGLVLLGSEIKSLRLNQVSIGDAYVRISHHEVFIINMFIAEYDKAALFGHTPTRERKLLLNKNEIRELERLEIKGYTFIPTKVILEHGRAKIVFRAAHGRKKHDKRELIKKRDIEKNLRQGGE
jgi:SsrA-binding protein